MTLAELLKAKTPLILTVTICGMRHVLQGFAVQVTTPRGADAPTTAIFLSLSHSALPIALANVEEFELAEGEVAQKIREKLARFESGEGASGRRMVADPGKYFGARQEWIKRGLYRPRSQPEQADAAATDDETSET